MCQESLRVFFFSFNQQSCLIFCGTQSKHFLAFPSYYHLRKIWEKNSIFTSYKPICVLEAFNPAWIYTSGISLV